jgi:hypothetical protein
MSSLTMANKIMIGFLALISILLAGLLYISAASESPKSTKGWFKITSPLLPSARAWTQKYSISSNGALHFFDGFGSPRVIHGNYLIEEVTESERGKD